MTPVRRAISVIAIAASLFMALSVQPPAASAQSARDLCVWFRPGGTGVVYLWHQLSSHEIRCWKRAVHTLVCYTYDVRWWGGWNGPYPAGGRRVTCGI